VNLTRADSGIPLLAKPRFHTAWKAGIQGNERLSQPKRPRRESEVHPPPHSIAQPRLFGFLERGGKFVHWPLATFGWRPEIHEVSEVYADGPSPWYTAFARSWYFFADQGSSIYQGKGEHPT
jgi:hypothetical protein